MDGRCVYVVFVVNTIGNVRAIVSNVFADHFPSSPFPLFEPLRTRRHGTPRAQSLTTSGGLESALSASMWAAQRRGRLAGRATSMPPFARSIRKKVSLAGVELQLFRMNIILVQISLGTWESSLARGGSDSKKILSC